MLKAKIRPVKTLNAGRITLLVFLSFLLVFTSSVYIFFEVYKPPVDKTPNQPTFNDNGDNPSVYPTTSSGIATNSDNGNQTVKRKNNFYSFLFVAFDNDKRLTDVLMLITVDVDNGGISMFQIPRDTYVNTVYRDNKINSIYSAAFNTAINEGKKSNEARDIAYRELSTVVSNTFGVPIDWYVSITLDVFRSILDTVGGIYMDVPIYMEYDDPDQDLHIHLQPGYQYLNPEQAEGVARYRKNNPGVPGGYYNQDIGRLETQRAFISALFKTVMASSNSKKKQIVEDIAAKLYSNLPLTDVIWFTGQMINISLKDIRMHVLPGEGRYVDDVSYFVAYKDATFEIINKYYNIFTTDLRKEHLDIKVFDSYDYVSTVPLDGYTADTLVR